MAETDTGFIVLFRAFTDWEWYDDALTVKLFIHLILSVNWVDKSWRGKDIKRGSMITSYGGLADATNMSVMKVRKRLKDLESTGEIIVKRTNKYSLVTVVKYGDYQDNDSKRTNKNHSNNKQRTKKEQQLNKGNKETKEKSIKKEFIIPSKIEIHEYFKERGFPEEAKKFYYFYDSKDWFINKNKMKRWKSSAGGWIARLEEPNQKQNELKL